MFFCDPLPSLIPFVPLSIHPHLIFVQSVIPKCYALDLPIVKHIPFNDHMHLILVMHPLLFLQFILLNSNPVVCIGLTAFPSTASFAKLIRVLLIPLCKPLMKILKSALSGTSTVRCNGCGMSWSATLHYCSSQDRCGMNKSWLFYWYATTWASSSEIVSNHPDLGRSEPLWQQCCWGSS